MGGYNGGLFEMLKKRGLALLLCGVLSFGVTPSFSAETSQLSVNEKIISESGYILKVEEVNDISDLVFIKALD